MKKHLVIALTASLVFVNLAPIASSANSEASVAAEENVSNINTGLDITEPPRMILFSNQTESGGSTYKYVSKQVVNLSGINTLYQALLAGGLAAVPMGHPVARAMVTTGLSSNFKGYKYMRQTIYKKSDKSYYYYKVIDEFTNNKSTWKGPVTTSYQKVRK
ncbi:hypothetical protein ACUNAH_002891 [Listeria monocytogenes]